jgi:branched-chain amino acid transport system permease protein
VNWRKNRSTWIAAFVVAILVGYVIAQSWRDAPITFDSILFTVVVGVTIGSIYAVAASGLVVTYTTSGIFNFAQGAMGMFGAFVYWQLKVDWGVPTIPALLISVLVFAPLFGALVERVLMRRLTTAPLVAKLVVTIGLMVALMGLAVSIWDPNTGRTIPPLFPTSEGFTVGETFVP